MTILEAAKRAIERAYLKDKKVAEDKFQWREPLKNYSYYRLIHDCEYPDGGRPLTFLRDVDPVYHTIDLVQQRYTFGGHEDTMVALYVGTCPKCKLTVVAEVLS